MALGIERLFPGIVGEFDQEDHGDEDERRDQARGRSSPTPPIEADFVLFPVPDHLGNLAALTFWRKPKVPSKMGILAQLMQPVARPAAANIPRISPTCSSLCSAQSEQRRRVMPAGVAGGRARLT